MSAADLPQLLPAVVRVWAVLGDLLDGTRGQAYSDEPKATRDPRHKPAPTDLGLVEHRHTLVRGLRWWVDATDSRPADVRVGSSPAWMAACLLGVLPDMAPEDRTTLADNLDEWLAGAQRFVGGRNQSDDREVHWTPPEHLGTLAQQADRMVRVTDAAQLLGCSVRTIQRRAPRAEGLVRLGDVLQPPVPRCDRCDLPVGQCVHRATAVQRVVRA